MCTGYICFKCSMTSMLESEPELTYDIHCNQKHSHVFCLLRFHGPMKSKIAIFNRFSLNDKKYMDFIQMISH
jgi:hypothetical protein